LAVLKYRPGLQISQYELPSTGWCLLTGQASQSAKLPLVLVSLNLFAGQSAQLPALVNLPGGLNKDKHRIDEDTKILE
jgi:hypothetical protein